MTPEKSSTPEEAAQSILNGIFEKKNVEPDVFDAANLLAGVIHKIPGYREAYLILKSQVEEQRNEHKINSPQMILMRHVEGIDRLNEIDSIINPPQT